MNIQVVKQKISGEMAGEKLRNVLGMKDDSSPASGQGNGFFKGILRIIFLPYFVRMDAVVPFVLPAFVPGFLFEKIKIITVKL